MTQEQTCGTCRHLKTIVLDTVCTNEESPCCENAKFRGESCEEWELCKEWGEPNP